MNLLVIVGPPGSGKSTLAKSLIENDGDIGASTVYINQDTQGKQHLQLFQEAVDKKANIIVDRMNFSKMQRARYLDPAKKAGYTTKIIVLHESRETCLNRCLLRENHPTIKDLAGAQSALNTFFGKYERPTLDEADFIEYRYPEGAKDECIVTDLDSTLCNISAREHHVRTNGKKNWKAFFEGISSDTINLWCQSILDMFLDRYPIVFMSGRPDNYRIQTETWIAKYYHFQRHIYMRPRNDMRPDEVIKQIILDYEILTRFKPLFFLDDRNSIVKMLRSRGFTVLQCQGEEY